jgi:homoserine O-acetyltransferase/O-succinyltransferase
VLAGCETPPRPSAEIAAPSSTLSGVESRTLVLHDFKLPGGQVLKRLEIVYETYGSLAPDGRNAVLISHGNTSTSHAAGRYAAGKSSPGTTDKTLGWWNAIIGPGKAFDTDKYFVVSSNMLGGAYGTTGPRSIDPGTGKPYGPDFPRIDLVDMVAVQRALLDSLGVKHLVAAAGPSYGGFLSFQWAITSPGMVDGIVVVVSSPTGGKNPNAARGIEAQLEKDPRWNGGWYYDNGGIVDAMTELRMNTLRSYGMDRRLEAEYPNPADRAVALRKISEPWARAFDGNSLIVQRRAMEFRDHAKDFGRIRAKVLYILSTTDKLFPTSLAPRVMGELRAAGVDATYVQLESDKGHSAGTEDAAKFAPALREFLGRL